MEWTFGKLIARARRYGRSTGSSVGRGGPRRRLAGEDVVLGEDFLRRLEQLSLLVRRPAHGGTAGEHRSQSRAASLEFVEYRHYVAGDDPRRVDWNVYGRLGNLFVKLTEATKDVTLHIVVDCSRSMDWGAPNKLLYARQLAAALGYLALARFDRVSVATFNERIQERSTVIRGKAQAMGLLRFLNGIEVGGGTNVDNALAAYCVGVARGGIAVLVSDLLSADTTRLGIERLMRAGLEVTVVHVLDPQEIRPGMAGEVELIDSETGETIDITIGQEARRAYEERIAAWCSGLRDFFVARGIGYLMVSTDTSLENLILRDLRERRLVR